MKRKRRSGTSLWGTRTTDRRGGWFRRREEAAAACALWGTRTTDRRSSAFRWREEAAAACALWGTRTTDHRSSAFRRREDAAAACALLLLLLAGIVPAAAAKKRAVSQSYATVAGTVFDQRGYALPSADVALIPDPPAENTPVKIKKLQALSDSRGEFAFHVPPGAVHYTVKVSAKGYQPSQKSVSVEGEERVDVTFQLEPESK